MKTNLQFLSLVFLIQISIIPSSHSQDDAPAHLIRAYWDDDYFNFYGRGTDRAYTDGTRLEYIHAPKKTPAFLLDKIMPTAGDSSINLYGWGITQLMFTPNDISKSSFQPNDYPWSGALFVTHTLYSYNQKEKTDIQTELVLGVMGPWALAGEMQTMVHRMIHYVKPRGWDNQYGNNILLNINLTGEKQLLQYWNFLEVIAGAHANAGSMINEVAIYSLIRIGKMTPYFNGYISQYTRSKKHKAQLYVIIKPQVEWVISNALLEGGVFPRKIQAVNAKEMGNPPYHPLRHIVPSFAYGPVLSLGHFSFSATQTVTSSWLKGLYDNQYGNLSFYFSW